MKKQNNEVEINFEGNVKKGMSDSSVSIKKMIPKKKKKTPENKSANLDSGIAKKKSKPFMIKSVIQNESDAFSLSCSSSDSSVVSAQELLNENYEEENSELSAEELLNDSDDNDIEELENEIKRQEEYINKLKGKKDNNQKEIRLNNPELRVLTNNKSVLPSSLIPSESFKPHQKKKDETFNDTISSNSSSDDIKLISNNPQKLKRCPVCKGKLKKSWIKKRDNVYVQRFKCKGKGHLFWKEKCEFQKELVMTI